MITHRCSICNKTDNEEIATELGDYTNLPFVTDPSDSNFFLCLDCYESIRDALDDFEEEDENILKE